VEMYSGSTYPKVPFTPETGTSESASFERPKSAT
jgi:hypothetical protein